MKKISLLSVFFLFFIISCNDCKESEDIKRNNHLDMAVLYQQRAAEYRALCYQAYNCAAMMLDAQISVDTSARKKALVFDIDETVLDNSPFEAKCALEGISYPDKWDDWCNLSKARPVPGAVKFINDAYNKGIAIFYISNRHETLREATKKNLLSEGLPLPDDSFLLMKTKESSKETRRELVIKDYDILLLIGDNLSDFSCIFDNKLMEERNAIADSLSFEFGKRFIVLPNAMYGDWEGALYDFNYNISDKEKDEIRKKLMIRF